MLVSALCVCLPARCVEKALVPEVGYQVVVSRAEQADTGDARETYDVRIIGLAPRSHDIRSAIHLCVVLPPRPAPSREHPDRAEDPLVPRVFSGELPPVRDLLLRSAIVEESAVHRAEVWIVCPGENEVGDVRVDDQAQGAIASR